jgi:hypothetical protein
LAFRYTVQQRRGMDIFPPRTVLLHPEYQTQSLFLLDTAQRVIQKHFGAIAFDSKPGETTFRVRLPLDRAEVY